MLYFPFFFYVSISFSFSSHVTTSLQSAPMLQALLFLMADTDTLAAGSILEKGFKGAGAKG
jgi:hypothetical protein